jgi:hypothetical protein
VFSFFLDPEDIESLTLRAIWNLAKERSFVWFSVGIYRQNTTSTIPGVLLYIQRHVSATYLAIIRLYYRICMSCITPYTAIHLYLYYD